MISGIHYAPTNEYAVQEFDETRDPDQPYSRVLATKLGVECAHEELRSSGLQYEMVFRRYEFDTSRGISAHERK